MSAPHDHTDTTKRPLPDGWRWVRLGELIREAQPGFACGERDPNGVIQLRMNNVDIRGNCVWDEFIRVPADATRIERYVLKPGDVLFNNTNSVELVGKTALFTGYKEPVVYSNHFTVLRTKDELDADYLARFLVWQWQNKVFEHICDRWIGQSAVKNDKLLAIELPLPPFSEQQRIAAVLREQMAAVERARKAIEEQLEAINKLPAALLRQVFPRPGQPLPHGWKWVRLGEVCDLVNGFAFREDLQGSRNLEFPFIKVSDMNAVDVEETITSAANTVNDEILQILGARTYPPGTIIFPKVGGALLTNKKRILGVEAAFDNNIMGLVPRTVETQWVFFWMQTIDLTTFARTQALPSIRRSDVSELQLPLAPLEERKRIAALLREQMAAAARARRATEEQLEAAKALPAALLRQVFPRPGQPLPDRWQLVRLGEVCRQDRNVIEPQSALAQTLPYLSLEHVESGTGRILKKDNEVASDEGVSATFAFDCRHVLYGKLRPYLNKVALPDFAGRCTTEMIPLLATHGTDREFLGWVLRRPETVDAAMRGKTGSRMPRADVDELMNLLIPLPPLSEQRRIAAILREQMAAAERARKAIEEQLEAINKLPAAILRKAFNGEL